MASNKQLIRVDMNSKISTETWDQWKLFKQVRIPPNKSTEYFLQKYSKSSNN